MVTAQGRSAVLYCRVSTEEQAEKGVSLEAQDAAIRAYCQMRGLEVMSVIVDAGVSGSIPLEKRPGGKHLLELVKSGKADAVVAYKLDRLFRDCSDCLNVVKDWDNESVALHLVDIGGQTIDTRTAMGRFFLTVMAGAAELERNLIGERTKAALSHKKSQGVQLGQKTYTQLAPETAQLVKDLYATGNYTHRSLAEELTRRGVKTAMGRPKWTYDSVLRALRA